MTDLPIVISSMATRHVLADLNGVAGAPFTLRAMGGVDAARDVRAGMVADVVLLAANAMKALEAEGHVVAGTRRPFTLSAIGIAVREGAARPAIDTVEAVKAAMLGAATVGYSTGPSGDYLKTLWQTLGIAEAMASRAVQAPAGVPVAALVARGDAEIGFQQFSELLGQPGIAVLGLLPEAIQSITTFEAGVTRTSENPRQARDLIAALTAPETAAIKQRHGQQQPG